MDNISDIARNVKFLNRKVSFVRDVWHREDLAEITVAEFLSHVQAGKYRDRIEKLRAISDPKVYNDEKEKLPAILLSALFSTRSAKVPTEEKLIAHSALLQIDIDKIEDLPAMRAKVDADQYTAFSFVSPGGNGLKIGIRINPTRHDESRESAATYYLREYGVTIDPKVTEVARLLFVSWDPDLFINPDAKLFPITKAARPEPVPARVVEDPLSISDQQRKHGLRALETAKKMIEQAKDGEKLNDLLKAGELLGGYVAGGMLTKSESINALRAAIDRKPNVNSQKTAYKAIDDAIEDGMTNPISFEVLAKERKGYCERMGFKPPEPPPYGEPRAIMTGYTAQELMQADFPEPVWVVPNLICEGFSLVAGKPKLGKSWLMLGFGVAVSSAGMVLGSIPVEAGRVLYLSLEDSPRRLKKRLQSILRGASPPANLHFFTEWPKIDQGGKQELHKWIEAHKDTRLVIVDTIAKMWPKPKQRSNSGTLYNADYETISLLKSIADQHCIGLVGVTHERKAEAQDPIEKVTGSMGMTGGADTVLILQRARGKMDAKLIATGRDIEEQELALHFDKEFTMWTLLGAAAEYERSQSQLDLIEILKQTHEPMTIKELCDITKKSKQAVYKILQSLCSSGLVTQPAKGKYTSSGLLGLPGLTGVRGLPGLPPDKVNLSPFGKLPEVYEFTTPNPHEIRDFEESKPSNPGKPLVKCFDCLHLANDSICAKNHEVNGTYRLRPCGDFSSKETHRKQPA